MTTWGDINGERIVSGRVTIPMYGLWIAEIGLAIGDTVAQSVTMTLGDLVMQGTVFRQASFAQSRTLRIVGGAGGWSRILAPQAYRMAAGVPLSIVVGDAATAAGESFSLSADRSLGPLYGRAREPGSRLLARLFPLWYMRPDGVTTDAPRASSPVSSPFTVITYSGGGGRFEIATEALSDWLPGRSFTSPTLPATYSVSAVQHEITNDGPVRSIVLSTDTAVAA